MWVRFMGNLTETWVIMMCIIYAISYLARFWFVNFHFNRAELKTSWLKSTGECGEWKDHEKLMEFWNWYLIKTHFFHRWCLKVSQRHQPISPGQRLYKSMSSNISRSNFNNLTSPIIWWCIESIQWLTFAWKRTAIEWCTFTGRKRPTWRSRLSSHSTHVDAKKECRLDAAACKLIYTAR